MTIRGRLTLWYAGILFVSTLLITALTYRELATERAESLAGHLQEEQDEPGDVAWIVLWCGIPAALLGLAGGWWLMRQALTPVTALTRAAAGIHETNLGERLPQSGNGDELDQLTQVFNAMLARLETSFARIREFTLHASHELKTPLTVMHAEVETELREQRNPAQRERLASQLDEIQRLTKIVDGLTLLTKADAGQIRLQHEPIRLAELVRDCFADAQILARPRDVAVQLTACEEAAVAGDRHRLRQLLLNLTDNAIKYNHLKGTVTIDLRQAGGFAELTVANTGPGIPPELQTRVFDRFFRCDASHNGEVEGCGLGLSIARWIVNAHEGTIQLTSLPEKLTTVKVRLPLARGGVLRTS